MINKEVIDEKKVENTEKTEIDERTSERERERKERKRRSRLNFQRFNVCFDRRLNATLHIEHLTQSNHNTERTNASFFKRLRIPNE